MHLTYCVTGENYRFAQMCAERYTYLRKPLQQIFARIHQQLQTNANIPHSAFTTRFSAKN